MRIEVQQGADEIGELEEFTWDLFPLVDASETTHLDESGLPKVGSRIGPGMIIVGKIAKTRSYDPERQPTALEIHGLDFPTLRDRYGHMWQDRSLYADETRSGVVRDAYFESQNGSTVAVVQIEKDASGRKSRGRKAAAT
jgi:DNA-directed RNA polymerase beta subunit